LDRDEIWQDCSSSKYTSIDTSDITSYYFQDGGHDVISHTLCMLAGVHSPGDSTKKWCHLVSAHTAF